jgi:phage host-nuclease inhibitor protein Gam
MTMMNSELYTALKSAGAAEAEAQAAASSVLSSELGATRADIAELRTEMAELRAELKTEMAELRAELKTEIAGLRAATKDEIAQLRTELYRLVAGQTIVLVGIMAALKLFG